jgi:hypothetical protein
VQRALAPDHRLGRALLLRGAGVADLLLRALDGRVARGA